MVPDMAAAASAEVPCMSAAPSISMDMSPSTSRETSWPSSRSNMPVPVTSMLMSMEASTPGGISPASGATSAAREIRSSSSRDADISYSMVAMPSSTPVTFPTASMLRAS